MDLDQALRSAAEDVRRATGPAQYRGRQFAHPRARKKRFGFAVAVLVVAAAVVTVVAIATPRWWLDRGDGRGGTGDPAASTARNPICGRSVPIPLFPPTGYRGPVAGPAAGARPAWDGQLVVHWQGSGGAVEARWPADPEYRIAEAATGDPISVTKLDSGTVAAVGDALVPGAAGACEHLQLTFYGSIPDGYEERMGANDGTEFERTFQALFALVTDPMDTLLVTGTRDVTRTPSSARPCPGGDTPLRSGRASDLPPAPQPEEALRRFLDQSNRPTTGVAGYGYIKLVGPDATIVFGRPFEGGSGYVVLVWMRQTSDGWVADHWQTSGC